MCVCVCVSSLCRRVVLCVRVTARQPSQPCLTHPSPKVENAESAARAESAAALAVAVAVDAAVAVAVDAGTSLWLFRANAPII